MEFEIVGEDLVAIRSAIDELVNVSNSAFDDFYKKGKMPMPVVAIWREDKGVFYLTLSVDEKEVSRSNPFLKPWVWRWKRDTLNGLKKWFKDKNIKVSCRVL